MQLKLLILIVSPNIFHWKSAKESKVGVVFGAKCGPNVLKKNKGTGISMVFFHILHEVYIYKQKSSDYRNLEWKLKTILARNIYPISKKLGQDLIAHFKSKIAKSDYFRGSYFSQSLSHILGINITSVFLRN